MDATVQMIRAFSKCCSNCKKLATGAEDGALPYRPIVAFLPNKASKRRLSNAQM